MTEQERSRNVNKRRKLDELFADEPYLSTTMKANRLHEKLKMLEERERAAQGLPTEAYVVDRNSSSQNVTSADVSSRTGNVVVTFSQAKRYYSEGYAQDMDAEQALSLDRVRNSTLEKWLANLPNK